MRAAERHSFENESVGDNNSATSISHSIPKTFNRLFAKMKIVIVLLVVFALAHTRAQAGGFGAGLVRSFVGFPSTQFFQEIVLQSEAQKLLTTPDFPEDLQARVLDTMSSAETGFNDCNSSVSTLPWMQIRCVALQLQRSKTELKAIDDEAKARAAAAATTAPAAGATGTA